VDLSLRAANKTADSAGQRDDQLPRIVLDFEKGRFETSETACGHCQLRDWISVCDII
jgi:hypothetical protein